MKPNLLKKKAALCSAPFLKSGVISVLLFFSACNPFTETHIGDEFHPGVALSTIKSNLISSSFSVVSGNSIDLLFYLKDSNGQPFVSRIPVVTFIASGGTSTGTLSAVTNQGDGSYLVHFFGVNVGTMTTAQAIVDGVPSASTQIQVTNGIFSRSLSTLSLSASTVLSGANITVTLTTKDNAGNQISSGGLAVSFSSSGGSSTGTFGSVTDNNDGTYSVSFTGVVSGSATTISASISGGVITSSLPGLTVTSGPVSTLAFTTAPSTTGNTDAALSTQPALSAKDAAGNVVSGYASAITLISYSDTGCVSAVASGLTASTNPVTASSGVASFTGLKILKTNVQSIQANDGTRSACFATLAISAGAPAAITVASGNAQSGAVNAALSIPFIAVVNDANNNAVPAATVDWAVVSGGGALSSASNPTNASGLSSSTLTLGSVAGTNTVTATVHATAMSTTFTATSSAGAATKLAFYTQPSSSAIAGGSFTTQPIVVVRDASNNTVTTSSASITLAVYSDNTCTTPVTTAPSGVASIGGTASVAASSGVSTFSGILVRVTGNTYVQASSSGLTSACSSASAISPAAFSLSQSALAVSSATVVSGSSITATLTTKDTFGNVNPTGVTAVTYSSSMVGGTGIFGSTTNVGSGVYTSSFTGNQAGLVTLSGLINSSTISSTQNVTVSAGAVSTLAFTTSPSTAGNTDTALATQPAVSAKDAAGNVVSGYASAITLTSYSDAGCVSTVASGLTASTNPVTASSGVATFVGVKILKTNVQSVQAGDGTRSVCFATLAISAGAPAAITVAGGNNQIGTAGSPLPGNLQVLVKDANNNVVPGVTIDWAATSGGGSSSVTSSTTLPSGLASSTFILGTTAGANSATGTIHATVFSISFTETGVAGAPVAAKSTLLATTNIIANGSATASITLTLRDTNNNVVTGFNSAQLTLAATGTGNTLNAFSGITNALGQVAGSLSSTVAQSKTISISADSSGNSLNATASVITTFVPGPVASLSFSTQPPASGTSGINLTQQPVVTLFDANLNIVTTSSASITLSAYSDASCTAVIAGAVTATSNPVNAASGVASFSNVKVNKVTAIRVGASDGTYNVCSTAITIAPAAPTVIALSGANLISVGSCAATYTLTAQDASGNSSPVASNTTFSLATTGSGAFYSNNTCTTGITTVTVNTSLSSAIYYYKNNIAETITQSANFTGYSAGSLSVLSKSVLASVVLGQPDFNTNNNAQYGLNSSSALAINANKLYVWHGPPSTSTNSRLLMYSSTLTANQPSALANLTASSINQIQVNTPATLSSNPGQLATDTTHLLAADKLNSKVQIYSPIPTTNNATVSLFLGTGTAGTSSTTLSTPSGVASDGTHVVVADTNNHRLLIWNTFPATSSQAANLVLGQANFTSGLVNAGGSTSSSTLSSPQRVLIVGVKLIVIDQGNHRVLIWNTFPTANQQPADVVIGQPDFITFSSGLTSQKMNTPQGLAYDGSNFYVVDKGNHRVLLYNSLPSLNNTAATFVIGQPNFTTGSSGTSSNTFNAPTDIIASANNNIFISDGQARVLNWTTAITGNQQSANYVLGQPTMTTSTSYMPGPVSGTNLQAPNGVCSDGTSLFASDLNHRILVWSTIPVSNNASPTYVLGQPNFLSSTANNPSTALGLNISGSGHSAGGLKCDSNYLGIADTANHRILIWNLPIISTQQAPNRVLGQSTFTTNAQATTQNGMKYPGEISINANKVAVADTSNYRVLLWNQMPTADGQNADLVLGQPDFTTATINQAGLGSLKSLGNDISGVFFDGTHLIVGDSTSNRLLIWNSWPTVNQQPADFSITNYSGMPWSDGTKLYVMSCSDSGQGCRGLNRILVWNNFPTSNKPPDRVIGQADTTANSSPTLANITLSGTGGIFSVAGKFFSTDYWFHRILIWNAMP